MPKRTTKTKKCPKGRHKKGSRCELLARMKRVRSFIRKKKKK